MPKDLEITPDEIIKAVKASEGFSKMLDAFGDGQLARRSRAAMNRYRFAIIEGCHWPARAVEYSVRFATRQISLGEQRRRNGGCLPCGSDTCRRE